MTRNFSPGIEFADHALEAWARWTHTATDGLGWPRRTLLAKIMEEGFTGAAQGSPHVEMPDLVLFTERAVLRLVPPERKVILKHYLNWEPVEVSARRCHMSPGRFRTLLHRARRDIAAYLDGALMSAKNERPRVPQKSAAPSHVNH